MTSNRKIALLGALIALNVLARLLGPGFGGVEPIFALLVLQGYVFGASFGAMLGGLSLLTSALFTSAVGPWLPFQMLGAAIVAGIAGLLPAVKNRWGQIAITVVWGIFGAYLYGATVTLWQWPLLAGSSSSLSYLPEGTIVENAIRFVQYSIFSGGILWDTGRALTTVIILVILGSPMLAALNRAAKRIGLKNRTRRFAKSETRQPRR